MPFGWPRCSRTLVENQAGPRRFRSEISPAYKALEYGGGTAFGLNTTTQLLVPRIYQDQSLDLLDRFREDVICLWLN